jgi:hypothetical protein
MVGGAPAAVRRPGSPVARGDAPVPGRARGSGLAGSGPAVGEEAGGT